MKRPLAKINRIAEWCRRQGEDITADELRRAYDLHSQNYAHQVLCRLHERGVVRRVRMGVYRAVVADRENLLDIPNTNKRRATAGAARDRASRPGERPPQPPASRDVFSVPHA